MQDRPKPQALALRELHFHRVHFSIRVSALDEEDKLSKSEYDCSIIYVAASVSDSFCF